MKYAIEVFAALLIMQLVLPASVIQTHNDSIENTYVSDTKSIRTQDDISPTAEETAAENVSIADEGIVIKLSRDGEVKEMPLEEYLIGVVFAEMPASFEPEALKAQAVAARSYTMYKMLTQALALHENGAHICTDYAHCSAYISFEDALEKYAEEYLTPLWEKVAACVKATSGEIMTYQGQPINAVFHAMSYKATESSSDVWGGDSLYLRSVASPEDEESGIDGLITVSKFTGAELAKLLKDNGYKGDLSDDPSNWLGECTATPSGRVESLEIGTAKLTGTRIRELFSLRSAKFELAYDNGFIFTVYGYGHGVGMSQQGANLYAKRGMKYREILAHYYTGADIVG